MVRQCIAAIVFASSLASGLAAARDYPTRDITFIVPQNPGGTTDNVARVFAEAMSKVLGQEIIVEYRPGGGNTIGMGLVASAEPDGYTLGVGSSGAGVIAPLTIPDAGYTAASFEPVFKFADVTYAVVANADLGVTTVDELVALAKERPGELNYGSGGAGGVTHFAGAMFSKQVGIGDITVHIPYQGGGEAAKAVSAGEVHYYMGPVSSSLLGAVDSGKAVALAVTGDERIAPLPDAPSFLELGIAEGSPVAWFGLVAPRGTPKEIIDRLNAAANQAIKSQELIDALAKIAITPKENTVEDFRAQIESDVSIFGEVMESGIISLN
jgi:tripartite-type tricarboxylate transporter receptor subunit TctC